MKVLYNKKRNLSPNKIIFLNFILRYLKESPNISSLVGALVFSSLLLTYWFLNVNITPTLCAGAADCLRYLDMARSFTNGEYSSIDYPFNLRIMSPWLASIISNDVSKGFIWLNGTSALFFIIFCFKIINLLNLRNLDFWILTLWFFLHPLGFGLYFSSTPQSADPLYYAFIGLVTLLFISQKRFLLWTSVSIALLAKESFIFIVFIIVLAEFTYVISTRDKRALPALTSICGAVFVLLIYKIEKNLIQNFLFSQTQEYEITFLRTILFWLNEIWIDPKRLIVWIGSIFCSTGLFTIFVFLKKYTPKSPLKTRLDVYFILGSFGFIVLGLLAGSDMSRIIFNGNLLIILAILISCRNQYHSINELLITLSLSILTVLNYTRFFPKNFEYGYYLGSYSIAPTINFILIIISIMSFLYFLFKKFPKNRNILIDSANNKQ